MFLDDELNEIYKKEGSGEKCSQMLMEACWKRFPNSKVDIKTFLNAIKQIDGSWRLFCKKHNNFNPNGFRIVLLRNAGNDAEKWAWALGW